MSAAKPGRALMVVGTHSNAGKSILVTALCRIFAQEGYRVAPFKSQNMSLNAAVTPEGCEIARSTFAQAEAAGVPAHVDMNPVLLKPEGECRSQIVFRGRPQGHLDSKNWRQTKALFWSEITASLDRLRSRYDLVVMEGAGSPAEINLKAGDVANLRVARYADAPSLLVGDIDRGGVFAALVGTMVLLEPEERDLIRGFVINKLRGDPNLLGDGLELLRARAFDVPTLGVVPFLPQIGVAEEDSVVLDEKPATRAEDAIGSRVDIAVVRLPHLANFDDFDPLAAERGVHLRYVRNVDELRMPAAVILPGTKVTMADLAWLEATGLAAAIVKLGRAGTPVVGICGGYQMLGQELEDPEGSEAAPGSRMRGLGLLRARTTFAGDKRTVAIQATVEARSGPFAALSGTPISAYEIHMGRTSYSKEDAAPIFRLGRAGRSDGMASAGIWGTYLHGLFDNDAFRHGWLQSLGWREEGQSFDRQKAYNRLAEHFRNHLDMAAIHELLREQP